MILETAFDPKCFSRPEAVDQLARLGISKGAVLSLVPAKWLEAFKHSIATTGHRERAKLILAELIKNGSVVERPSQAGLNDNYEWLEWIRRESTRWPYDLVVLDPEAGAKDHPNFWTVDKLAHSDQSPLDRMGQIEFQQTEREFVRLLLPLFRYCSSVFVCDQYLNAGKDRAIQAIRTALRDASKMRASIEGLEVTFFIKTKYPSEGAEHCTKLLEALRGIEWQNNVRLFAVAVWPGHFLRLHNRYLLSERAGIMTGDSFVSGNGKTTDDAVLLKRHILESRFRQFQDARNRAVEKGQCYSC